MPFTPMTDLGPHRPSGDPDANGGEDRDQPPPVRLRSAREVLLFGLTKHRRKVGWLVAVAVVALLGAAWVFRYTGLNWKGIIAWIDGLHPLAVLPVMAFLPIAGFPISVVYLVAGARFGPIWGGVVVTGATAVHLLGTYLVAHSFLREPLQRFIARRHVQLPQIPPDEQAAVGVIAALIPGLPYVVRNYLLALAGVRLRLYFWVCLPIYVARSYVSILMGDMGSSPTTTKIAVLIAVDVVKVGICALVIWRLRVHHRKYHGQPEAGPDHPSGPPPIS